MSNLFDLTGKVAIVTGSSRGIGRATAEAMAAHGAKVVVSSRKADKCEEVAEEIKNNGNSEQLSCTSRRSPSRMSVVCVAFYFAILKKSQPQF